MRLKISAALTVLLFIALTVVGAPLNTDSARLGIVSFELARTTAAADSVLASWDAAARLHAAFSLGLDYLFLFAYGAFFALASLKSGEVLRARRSRLAGAARPLAAAAILAALLDIIENLALAAILFGGQAVHPWPFVAWLCAAVKFSLLGIVAGYVLFSAGNLIFGNIPQANPFPGRGVH